MNVYEQVFAFYASALDPEELEHMSREFYVSQVGIILGWTDLSDSEQLKKITALDYAYRVIVEGKASSGSYK
ncbi:hypothetical protein M5X00_16525 [Paenibacillus alvei]|uniref:Uncharacterized protein n=1 Tax=Paenibacillus alvei TaxID=44250 RepID=A0ABT4H8A8_PAEAL|nr:hypothetical protein [Paenibacillus alvei]EJW17564.1 hypothetical protein PAV_3c00090 [Paenibacillus alvei DSM 29]MCY9544541.1 hypothetical protein [Paenibacillus alvei]MCY9706940.1 hypothetical protein [Paenibacillus alvei]MCY9736090.1 hypothetical protein [Paenibacillus alvei]MCY9755846.1 hypothetical protein [Paenibacillus alvei]